DVFSLPARLRRNHLGSRNRHPAAHCPAAFLFVEVTFPLEDRVVARTPVAPLFFVNLAASVGPDKELSASGMQFFRRDLPVRGRRRAPPRRSEEGANHRCDRNLRVSLEI
ncbi:MAG TPA: hypothetical protein VH397_19295, partial [Xanthobacteraceae bacterium]